MEKTTITYAQALENAINALSATDKETADKLSALKAQLAKKSSSGKQTEKQKEMAQLRDDILTYLTDLGEFCNIPTLMAEYDKSNQVITRALTDLKKDGKVINEKIKGVSHYKAVVA